MAPLRHVCVYCGSNVGDDPAFLTATVALGAELARRGIGVVYGGGAVGLMGALADAALDAGGEVTGIIPRDLAEREVGHDGVTELVVVGSMHERKLEMARRSDAFIALPGGVGTLEEVIEVLTWTQLGFQAKPVGLADVAGYYAPLVAFLDHAVVHGFVHAEDRAALLVDEDPIALLDRLPAWVPSSAGRAGRRPPPVV